MIPPAGKCVWGCESGQPFNRENIIGQQFATILGVDFPITMRWGDLRRSTGERMQVGERIEHHLALYLDDRVCKRCNGKWMKRLDDRCADNLRPALEREEPVSLSPKKQLVVARWATKVALLLALWLEDQPLTDPGTEEKGSVYAPADNFARLYANSSGVPDRTRIWIGALHPTVVAEDFFIASNAISTEAECVGYHTTFSLRRMVFFVTGLDLAYSGPTVDGWPDPSKIASDPMGYAQLWPRLATSLTWPPGGYLRADDLTAPIDL